MSESTEWQKTLENRLVNLLPEMYRDYENVQPTSMGSTGLVYQNDGKVAWERIWRSFCDLALAGGPPHRGKLLETSDVKIAADLDRYHQVVAELCRGVQLVSGLKTTESKFHKGWICVNCNSRTMARWLVRAITAENISCFVDGMTLYLPAAPDFRIEKEIKNVVTTIAKTCHYWTNHISIAKQRVIEDLLIVLEAEMPLLQPSFPLNFSPEDLHPLREQIAAKIQSLTGRKADNLSYNGWLGIECGNVPEAISLMRSLIVSNALSRREDCTIFIPVNPASDTTGDQIVYLFGLAHQALIYS